MRPLGWVDGRMIDLSENAVPMEDRGHQFGDGVYEVTRVYNSQCFALKPHLDRLYRSLRELRIPITYTMDELRALHEQLIAESGIVEGGVYLQITRGVAPRGHGFPEQMVPRLTMSIRPSKTSEEAKEKGVKIILIPDERWLRCDIKSLNLLGNVLGKQRAKEAGCFEAVMLRDDIVTEGTSSNFYAVKDGIIWTHPTSHLILNGVTRKILLEDVAPSLGFTVLEKAFDSQFLAKAEEAFLSGTTTEVMPVVSIDGKPVGNGQVGPVTRKLQTAYQNLIKHECFM